LDWAEDAPRASEAFVLALDGFEGPLDLLLALARLQKVDLTRLSMTALADQYLAFISAAAKLRLELAADYLVMAAWLAYLKSRLLLPRERHDDVEPTGEELAQRLAFRLMRLNAMREAAAQLMSRLRLGRDVFGRGMPEGVRTVRDTTYTAQIYDLLKAYAEQRQRTAVHVHVVKARTVWSIKEARSRLAALVGENAGNWVQLDLFLERYLPAPEAGKTVLASSFGATLEMARDGLIEIRQEAPFAPLYVRQAVGRSSWRRIT
jgi:segregation and condensation protein A